MSETVTSGTTVDQTSIQTFQADSDQSLSEAVVNAVATVADLNLKVVAEEFGPLYESIDPEAMDALFQSPKSTARNYGKLSFQYAEYKITVDANRQIAIQPQ